MSNLPSFRPLVFPSLFLILAGWGGLIAIVVFTEPLVWMRWGMFALLFMALTGTSLPIVHFFHKQAPSDPPVGTRVIVRQSQWVAIYGLVLLWLRWGNLLTLWLTLGLGAGLVLIEWLLRMRERSLWQPPPQVDGVSPVDDPHDQPA